MKNSGLIQYLFSVTVLLGMLSGCTIEPVQFERDAGIKGAPDWVNRGSMLASRESGRVFVGVDSANPTGDLALQKSIAEDSSATELASILSDYLDAVANEYLVIGRTRENGFKEESISRQLEDAATRQIKEGVSRQLDEAIARQFKEKPSRQFRDDAARQINEAAMRPIKEAIAMQIDFSHQLEEIIAQQINVAVSRQIKSTIKGSMASTRIVGSWRDPKTAMVWSITELDIKAVKSAVAGSGEINADLKHFFETHADAIFDRVINEQDNMGSFRIR